jgi:malic enzyme
MNRYRVDAGAEHGPVLEVPYRGVELLQQPLYNKSTAFTHEERAAFELTGLLPDAVSDMAQQARRARANVLRKTDPLERYIGLAALQDRNEHLFYRVLIDDLEEFLPVVYTPTVGRACQEYSHIFRRARGLWITPRHRGHVAEVLEMAPFEDVRLIVVTDNERILGLGDQGAGGMGIPVGKLALYTAAAGIAPWQTLPISLDVGTDNRALLEDDLYLGWRHPRLRGADYESLVDEFVQAVRARFPRALLQWEDFKKGNAFRLLSRYRQVLPSFNDDVQGTAAVTLAAVLAAERSTGTALADERFVILGAGAAGIGIAGILREALGGAGITGADAQRRIALVDSKGLLADEGQPVDEYKRAFAWPRGLAAAAGVPGGTGLEAVVRALRPTVLVGTSGQAGSFTREIVSAMAGHVERPVVLPLSNPTANSEATPEQVLEWTSGRALMATGSPFAPVARGGRTHAIGQANNAFVFLAVGLACIVGEAREVPDSLFAVAACALAAAVTPDDLAAGRLLPPASALRQVTRQVAAAVLGQLSASGLGRKVRDEEIETMIERAMWEPRYLPLRPVPPVSSARIEAVRA